MELKTKYQYTYFIYPFAIKESKYTKYLLKLLKDDNCELRTKVTITTSESGGPLAKPEFTPVPSWHTWDPTDPTVRHLCEQHGCH